MLEIFLYFHLFFVIFKFNVIIFSQYQKNKRWHSFISRCYLVTAHLGSVHKFIPHMCRMFSKLFLHFNFSLLYLILSVYLSLFPSFHYRSEDFPASLSFSPARTLHHWIHLLTSLLIPQNILSSHLPSILSSLPHSLRFSLSLKFPLPLGNISPLFLICCYVFSFVWRALTYFFLNITSHLSLLSLLHSSSTLLFIFFIFLVFHLPLLCFLHLLNVLSSRLPSFSLLLIPLVPFLFPSLILFPLCLPLPFFHLSYVLCCCFSSFFFCLQPWSILLQVSSCSFSLLASYSNFFFLLLSDLKLPLCLSHLSSSHLHSFPQSPLDLSRSLILSSSSQFLTHVFFITSLL